MYIEKLASAVHNNVLSGLAGYHTNYSLNRKLLEDAVVDERLQLIREYTYKGLNLAKDLYISINCIPVDCKNIERCRCKQECGTPTLHFEIPQLVNELRSIEYIGAVDRGLPFIYYSNPYAVRNHKFRKRSKNKPYVWIDTTPNENGMYDCFVYNAPMLNLVSITAIFKDPRLLDIYSCCNDFQDENMSALSAEIIDRLSKKMISYYRLLHMPPIPNNQMYNPG